MFGRVAATSLASTRLDGLTFETKELIQDQELSDLVFSSLMQPTVGSWISEGGKRGCEQLSTASVLSLINPSPAQPRGRAMEGLRKELRSMLLESASPAYDVFKTSVTS
jgi:hypothetical protein